MPFAVLRTVMLKLCVSPLLEVMLALVVPAFSPLTVSFAPSNDAVATAVSATLTYTVSIGS